jgi:outer membrane protein TolC
LAATSAAGAQASSQLVQARAARLSDTVALFQAVGGGVASPSAH